MASDPFFPASLSPSEDFHLNVFLGKIADEITEEDFEKLKFYCKGQYGIGKRALEEMKTPLDLFTNLMERELLNRDNILTLQSMLWHLPRKDLQKKCVEFCQLSESTLHFKVPREQPENGYKYVKFHVQGKKLDNFKKDDLERLRSTVASQLLFIPQQSVIISGLEISNSLIITFMVPQDCDITTSPISLESLWKISVDVIYVNGKPVYTKADMVKADENLSVMESEAGKLLSRYQEKEKQVERLESKVSSYKRLMKTKLEELRKEREHKEVKTSLIAQLLVQICQFQHDDYIFKRNLKKYVETVIVRPMWSLQRLSAATLFRVALRKVRELKYDTDVISNLLDAQALLLQWQKYSELHMQNANLQLQIAQLQCRSVFTEYERSKLAYYHGQGEKDKIMTQREEYFMFMLSQAFALALPVPLSGSLTVTSMVPPELQKDFVRRLARELRKSDVKKLLKSLVISEEDRETLEHSAVALLEHFLAEENKKHKIVELRGFFTNLFAPLNRSELISKIDEHMRAAFIAHADTGRKGKGSRSDGKEKETDKQTRGSNDKEKEKQSQGEKEKEKQSQGEKEKEKQSQGEKRKEKQTQGSAEKGLNEMKEIQKQLLEMMQSFDERLDRMENFQTDSLSGLGRFPFNKNQIWSEKASYLSNIMHPENVGKMP